MGRTGGVLAEALNQSVLVGIEEDQVDANRARFAAKAIEIGSSFVPGASQVIPDAPGVVQTGYNTGQGQALGQLQENIKNSDPISDPRWDQKFAAGAGEQMKYGLYNTFVQEGCLHPDPSFMVDSPNGPVLDPKLIQDPGAVYDLPKDKQDAWKDFLESASPLENPVNRGWNTFSSGVTGQKAG